MVKGFDFSKGYVIIIESGCDLIKEAAIFLIQLPKNKRLSLAEKIDRCMIPKQTTLQIR